MSDKDKLLEFYREFYYELWGSDWISSDVLYDHKIKVEERLGYSNDDLEGDD